MLFYSLKIRGAEMGLGWARRYARNSESMLVLLQVSLKGKMIQRLDY